MPASMSNRFAALGDPVRLKIVETLATRPRSVSEIAGAFDMTLAGLLKHLGILEKAGLIQREKTGRVVTCTLNTKSLATMNDWTLKQIEFWESGMRRLKKLVEDDV
ncbi:MAG: winged helix-turn-helix transcriptional regulator [Spirochaetes bacterium]|nr:winged helix-turn-helix transcriptional regulator [Spirochaetota bacterium]MBX3721750.1 winged helix-turn-helix transcriptional regulator [Turneriella sp.]